MAIRVLFLLCLCCGSALAQSQQELNRQADAEFVKADRELNRVYQALVPRLQPITRKQLVAAQKVWIQFRDADAKARASENEGGSLYPMVYAGTRARLTRERTATLQGWLEESQNR